MSVDVGEIIEGTVSDIMNYGAFIKFEGNKNGLVHISEIAKEYIEDIHKVLKTGDKVKAKIISIDDKGKIGLSIRKAMVDCDKPETKKEKTTNVTTSLDDMLMKFLKDSDERQLDLKRNFESKRGSSRKRA